MGFGLTPHCSTPRRAQTIHPITERVTFSFPLRFWPLILSEATSHFPNESVTFVKYKFSKEDDIKVLALVNSLKKKLTVWDLARQKERLQQLPQLVKMFT